MNRLEIAQEFAKTVNSKYILKIILFGSVARCEDGEDSDIDILIVSNFPEKIEEQIDDEVAWIMHEKSELISAHIMSEDRFKNTQHFSFLSNVLSEGVEIG
ncbi:MAG: nucleotidyltransferase domain-containing protein [Methanobrevibacter sp.]|uniref:nucleotidyltransferase domain-containing protein n=1 Tax=Methanobrevibacter sp. TaxID=66852 RepID=UPI002600B72A|nr:nucleotidyltransferase domain-containing protein [Methanobrevibacter sp.]MBE6497038.1 nucleotidyltransferase domain-containing protein [Methanobrevibacter sp.]